MQKHNKLSGYDNVPDRIGSSNADHPGEIRLLVLIIRLHSLILLHLVLTPWLYTPSAAKGMRFTTGFANTTIARMYHSSATLMPDANILM